MGAGRRIDFIDGLRGMAALAVLIFHVWMVYPSLQHSWWGNAAFALGRHGVELFFVLSGFCLSYPTLLALHTRGSAAFDIVNYGARRLVRIMPPYLAAIIFSAIAFSALGYRLDIGALFRQATFLDNTGTPLNIAFWTLPLEFRWYFIFPLALLLWVRAPRVFWSAAAAIVPLWLTRADNIDLHFLPGFLLGIVAADIHIRGSRVARYAPAAFIITAVLAILIDPARGRAVNGTFDFPYEPAMFFAVVCAGRISWLRAACSARPLLACGLASYSIYLVHFPLIVAAHRFEDGPLGALTAAAIALTGGFAFWWIAERPWTATPLRARATAAVQNRLARYAQWLGVAPSTLVLGEAHLPEAPLEIPATAAFAPCHPEPVEG